MPSIIASRVSCAVSITRGISRHADEFGKGAVEGVAGPESANNAAVAGSIIPVLSLGIPGNAVTALLLGALVIHGVQHAMHPPVHLTGVDNGQPSFLVFIPCGLARKPIVK